MLFQARGNSNTKAQVFIEYTVAVIVLFMFLLGGLKMFLWFNKCISERQYNYEGSRVFAGCNKLMTEPILELVAFYGSGNGTDSVFTAADVANGPLLAANIALKPHLLDGFYNREEPEDMPAEWGDGLKFAWQSGRILRRAAGMTKSFKDLRIFDQGKEAQRPVIILGE